MKRKDKIEEIKRKCNDFDFEDFFFNESDDNYCAIKIITPVQDICFNVEYHDEGAELIMRGLYSDFNENFKINPYWPDIVNNRGCIAIQIIKRDFIIVNIPKKINSYQFNELFSFYQNCMNVNRLLRKKGEEEIELHTNISNNDNFLSLGRALIYLKNKIDDNIIADDELIINNEKNINL